jgi:hypothetical protein
METPPSAPQKKGLGALAWIGIGCGGIVILAIIGLVVSYMMFGGKIKEMAADAQGNPPRFAATTTVKVSGGQIEMIAQDDVNKRYTVREKQSGKLTTFYWDGKKNSLGQVDGDFSAIPADAGTPTPAPK